MIFSFSHLNHDLIPNIISYSHLKTVKRLSKSSKTLRLHLKSNYILWNLLAQSEDFDIQKNIEIVKNIYLIQKNIKRGQNEHIITFNTNQKDLTDLQVTSKGIFCSSDDSSVKEFSFKGKEVKAFLGHRGGVWAFTVCGSNNGSNNYVNVNANNSNANNYNNYHLLITGSTDKTARVWDRLTGSTICILQGHTSTIRALKSHSGFICTGGRDAIVRVWRYNGELVHVLRGHSESIRCMDMNSKYLLSGSYDGTVVLWDYRKGMEITSLVRHSKRVYAVVLGEKYVASTGLDAHVNISDLSGRLVSSHKCHTSLVAWLSFHNKERYLLSSGADNSLCKWDIEEKRLVYIIEDKTPITSHAVVNNLLVIATQKDVKVYDFIHGVFIRKLMEAETVLKMRVVENCIVVGFYSIGEYQIRIYKY